jgi:alpha-L-rhamnosidase
MAPKAVRPNAFARLVEDVMKQDGHLSTGLFGTKYLLEVLTSGGRPDLAARIVAQRTFPGWGFMLESGATTLWESWRKNEAEVSQNHPMLGSVGEWFYKHVGGIAPAPDAIGFDKIVMRPRPSKEVSWAKAHYQSVRGEIASDWSHDGGTFVWDVTVPVGTVATAYVPTAKETDVTEGGTRAARAPGVQFVRTEEGAAVFELRPGHYRFTTRTAPRMR